jgi:hypothetical protein
MTAQLDHVVVDRFGILIIESKVRNKALLKGSDVQRQWTACYASGHKKSFQNPLFQVREHENALRQALENAHVKLVRDYFERAVIFEGANLDHLDLDSTNRARVWDVAQIENLFMRRNASPPNAGQLTDTHITRLVDVVRKLDRSDDSAVVERHEAYRRNGRSSHPHSIPAYNRPEASRPSVPTTRYYEPYRPSSSAPSALRRMAVDAGERLVRVAVVAAIAWWFTLGGGYDTLLRLAFPSVYVHETPSAQEAAEAAPSVGQGVTVERARAALEEIAPELTERLANPATPIVTQVERGTTFEWEYVEVSGATATVRSIAVTLDANGQIIGVTKG